MPFRFRRLSRLSVVLALLSALPIGTAMAGDALPPEASAYAPAGPAEKPTAMASAVPDVAAAGKRTAAMIEAEATLKGAELEKLRHDMELSAERQAEIAAEIASLGRDAQALNDRLLATAGRVQALEQSISESEGRLARSADNEARIRASLQSRRAVLIDVLATAQRIGRRPPPALVVSPEDALSAVRSAIVLGAVLPEIRLEAEALQSDLEALVAERARAEAERDALKASAVSIAEERNRLDGLIEEKHKLADTRGRDLGAEKEHAESLAAGARSLSELIAALGKDLDAARRREGISVPSGKNPPSEATGLGGRLGPAFAFTDAKGKLVMPVRGVAIQSYGEDTGLGALSQGLSIATRAGAEVVAPADARVVFAGPFRSYGQLLILDAGDGYHIVMAGMDRLDVDIDQFVLTGEPVGTMGSQRLASATAPNTNFTQPVLYVEFRKDGTSIDPSPWWVASLDRKVGG
jgi:septal ring factor EnvC (AmiA/AmiB activator)